jgi:hypothetical protein
MTEVVAPPAPPAVKLDAIVERYIQLRDKKAEMKKAFDKSVEDIDNALAKLENFLLGTLQSQGVDSVKTPAGTAYRTTKTSATVEDWDAALAFIKENDAWNMLDKKVNKTAVVEYKDAHKALPPGVKWREEFAVNVRR